MICKHFGYDGAWVWVRISFGCGQPIQLIPGPAHSWHTHHHLKSLKSRKEVKAGGGSAACLLAGHSCLLFYMYSLLLLIPKGWSNLFFHSHFVNHPSAAARVHRLLPPELAAQTTVSESKDGKEMTGREQVAEKYAQSELLMARGSNSFTTCNTPVLLSARSRQSHRLLRAEEHHLHKVNLLVQLRSRPWKNTVGQLVIWARGFPCSALLLFYNQNTQG